MLGILCFYLEDNPKYTHNLELEGITTSGIGVRGYFLMGGLSVQQLHLCPIPRVNFAGAILLLFRYPLSLNVHSCYLSPICTILSGIIQPCEVRTYSVSSILITYDVFVIHVVYESAFFKSISNMGDSFTIFSFYYHLVGI